MDLSEILQAVRFTLRSPRAGARLVMNLDLPVAARWMALALMAIVSTLLTLLSLAASPLAEDPAVQMLRQSPIFLATLQGLVMLVASALIHVQGRWAGGTGRFVDALVLVVWLQVILSLIQAVQIVVGLVLPALADLIGVATLGLFVWLLTNFIAELHGFRSLVLVFVGILGTVLLLSLILSVVAAGLLAGG